MTRQNINIGSSANDGTGDTLRAAGTKINANFQEVYTHLGGDGSNLTTQISLKDSGGVGTIIFEGTSTDSHETKLITTNPTADRTIAFPDAGGNVVIDTATQTLTNKTLTAPDINSGTIDGAVIGGTTAAAITGTAIIGTSLTVTGSTGTVTLPTLTTTQRNALTGVNGMLIYNTTDSKIQAYAGGAWVNLH
tara:strand:- start:3818 stop:4393 length:576 start_codon:yes stop_codon:yes gene_type:complete